MDLTTLPGVRHALVAVLALPLPAFAESPRATIDDLHWMTGYWSGPLGEQTLEEQWLPAENGSIAGVIRISAQGKTAMIELILIEASEGSLVLRVRQWLPGFVPASDEPPMTMKLKEIDERSAKFEAVGPAALQSLGYSRPNDDEFHIDAVAATGPFSVKLARK